MSNSSRVPKQLTPFKKGDDPRRNALGRVSQERSTWMAKFLNALAAKLDPDEAAELFIKRYRAGVPFFVGEAHERLGGKVAQAVALGGSDGSGGAIRIEVVHIKGEGGNGNGGNGHGEEQAK